MTQFVLGHLLHRVANTLLAVAAFPDSAIGHRIDAVVRPRVDVDHPAPDSTSECHCAVDVLGEDAHRQAEGAVVGSADRIIEGGALPDGHRRAEQFVPPERRLPRWSDDDRRRDHRARRLATTDDDAAVPG
jgi:hypothetical protein